MTFTRSIATQTQSLNYAIFIQDRSYLSVISRPFVPRLVFKGAQIGKPFSRPPDGAVASGVPILLLFWGEWWNTNPIGLQRQAYFMAQTQALIASRYFDGLLQYGVAPPSFWGGRVVLDPAPPDDMSDSDEIVDMLDDLVDEGSFPDPDDQRVLPVIFFPAGYETPIAVGGGSNGYHGSKLQDWFDPQKYLDPHRFIYAVLRSFKESELDDAMRTVSHEVVEAMTDPMPESGAPGWQTTGTPPKGGGSEIGDEAELDKIMLGGVVQQAKVNGVQVCAYWSNEDMATIIPIDLDYSAQIAVKISAIKKTDGPSQHFRPDPNLLKVCHRLEDRDYTFNIASISERAVCSLRWTRYTKPHVRWRIGDKDITSSAPTTVTVSGSTIGGPDQVLSIGGPVTFGCMLSSDTLSLTITSPGGQNFDLPVSCTVHDDSIIGELKTDVLAAPSISVGFEGSRIDYELAYTQALEACLAEIVAKALALVHRTPPRGPFTPPGPIEIPESVLGQLPAYARLSQYRRAHEAVLVSRVVSHMVAPRTAEAIMRAMIDRAPALRSTLTMANTRIDS